MDDLAELAGLKQLPRQADRGHEAVVEAAEVVDARPRSLLPEPMRFLGGQPERLLADEMLAGVRGGDRRLRVEGVRSRVVEDLDPLVGDLVAPVGDTLGEAEALTRGFEASWSRPEIETSSGRRGTSRCCNASRARECAVPMKA